MLTKGLSDEQKAAVNAIDEDVEIIACAGAGKTGVVTRRIVNILKQKSEIRPENIVAFTFTEKAADELKSRIYKYGEENLGNTNGFANMFIGTIHGFCLKMLQEYIVDFQKFTVLDQIKTRLFIEKNFDTCGMSELGLVKYKETKLFMDIMSTLNENIFDKSKWNDSTQKAVEMYKRAFYDKKYFDFSLIMQEMLYQLENNIEFAKIITKKIKFLTVDEYQDINPIQERLIRFIKDNSGCNLCVVGDDDQTIYEFRGSDADNILTFKERYGVSKYIVLGKDYRSSEGIVDVAKRVILNNKHRLAKEMTSGAKFKYEDGDITYREFDDFNSECEFIAKRVTELHEAGVKYSEIAILMRKRKFGAQIAEALDRVKVPFIIEGVNELFKAPECKAAKGIFDYLAKDITMTDLFNLWKNIGYKLDEKEITDAIADLSQMDINNKKFYADFCVQQVFHNFLRRLSFVDSNGVESEKVELILYNLGKFSQVISDFETIYFSTVPKTKLINFNNFLKYVADGAYPEGHISNTYIRPDAVNIMTIHQSKGLEYTAVFVPQLNTNSFPSKKMGGKSQWHIIDKSWIRNSGKIAGDDKDERIEEERKLFYVAITRAKKFLFLTRSPFNKQENKVSTFLIEAKYSPYMLMYDDEMKYTSNYLPTMKIDPAPINLNFSILQDYFDCAYRFKLSMFYGFVQPLSTAMGYGKSMHEIVQNIHRKYISGEKLTEEDVQAIVDVSFYLPYANTKLEASMRGSAERTAVKYFQCNETDFDNITMAEADIELDMGDGIKVNGRIDLVKRREISGEMKTYIVDFKTKNRDVTECINAEQLKIYALGYMKLTGEKADYLEVYNLDNMEQDKQRVTDSLFTDVEKDIRDAANKIRSNNLERNCSKEKCQSCYLNYLCLSKKEKREFDI